MRWKQWLWISALMVALAGTSGCSLWKSKDPSVPPNPSASSTPPPGEEAGQGVQQTLYFVDGKGFVVPLMVKIPQVEGIAKEALQYMVEKGPGESFLTGTGLRGVLPEGTKIKEMSVNQEGLARVDLSREALRLPSSKEEEQMVEAVVWALTEFPNIKKVQLLFDGKIIPALSHGTPVGMALSREDGINLQAAASVNPSDCSKLTLYFAASNQEGNFHYFVPVTRLIPKIKAEEVVTATLSELAVGPKVEGLTATIPANAKLLSLPKVENGVASLDLSDGSLFPGNAQKASMESIESLVLSVTANASVNKVKITVNGKAPIAEKGLDLSKPVSRPQFINQKAL